MKTIFDLDRDLAEFPVGIFDPVTQVVSLNLPDDSISVYSSASASLLNASSNDN
jgi:hypothetical protein